MRLVSYKATRSRDRYDAICLHGVVSDDHGISAIIVADDEGVYLPQGCCWGERQQYRDSTLVVYWLVISRYKF